MQSHQPVGRLLPIEKVVDKTSKSRSSIYEDVKRGIFPSPVPISANRVAWPENEVDAWIAAKVSAARAQVA